MGPEVGAAVACGLCICRPVACLCGGLWASGVCLLCQKDFREKMLTSGSACALS
jgi:hypothetical protein